MSTASVYLYRRHTFWNGDAVCPSSGTPALEREANEARAYCGECDQRVAVEAAAAWEPLGHEYSERQRQLNRRLAEEAGRTAATHCVQPWLGFPEAEVDAYEYARLAARYALGVVDWKRG